MDRGNYRSIYSTLTIDPEFGKLSGGARGLWSLLVLHPSNGPSGIFYFPLSTLAEFSGYPPKTARKLFDELIDQHWILYDHEARVLWIRNQLRFDPSKPLRDPRKVRSIQRHLLGLPRSRLVAAFVQAYGLTEGDQLKELIENIEQSEAPSQAPPEAPSKGSPISLFLIPKGEYEGEKDPSFGEPSFGFAEFWEAYPKKQAKAAAEKAWRRLRLGEELRAAIMTALEQQRGSPQWTKDGGAYIPLPATWLNGRRWEDEVAEVQPEDPWKKYARSS